MRWTLLAAAGALFASATGCSLLFEPSGQPPPGADGGGEDDGTPRPDGAGDWEPWEFIGDVGAEDITLATACEIDTSADGDVCGNTTRIVDSNGRAVWALANLRLSAGVTLRVIGDRPLVIIAKTITIDGTIDASSDTNAVESMEKVGPGASAPPACIDGNAPQENAGGSGGAGGATNGGKGGTGMNAMSGLESGGGGGMLTPVVELAAGCPGSSVEARKAAGGGAIQLIATTELTIAGTIDVGGAGGRSIDALQRGGYGGGAGGMIVLDSPVVDVVGAGAQLFARGGGGGGGAAGGAAGMFGEDGGTGTGPAGGGGVAGGADGGSGGGVDVPGAGADAQVMGSGGGGGGAAAGFILLNSPAAVDRTAGVPEIADAPVLPDGST